MSITRTESEDLARRSEMDDWEVELTDSVLDYIEKQAKHCRVPVAGDDRMARFEAALIRYVIDSRK